MSTNNLAHKLHWLTVLATSLILSSSAFAEYKNIDQLHGAQLDGLGLGGASYFQDSASPTPNKYLLLAAREHDCIEISEGSSNAPGTPIRRVCDLGTPGSTFGAFIKRSLSDDGVYIGHPGANGGGKVHFLSDAILDDMRTRNCATPPCATLDFSSYQPPAGLSIVTVTNPNTGASSFGLNGELVAGGLYLGDSIKKKVFAYDDAAIRSGNPGSPQVIAVPDASFQGTPVPPNYTQFGYALGNIGTIPGSSEGDRLAIGDPAHGFFQAEGAVFTYALQASSSYLLDIGSKTEVRLATPQASSQFGSHVTGKDGILAVGASLWDYQNSNCGSQCSNNGAQFIFFHNSSTSTYDLTFTFDRFVNDANAGVSGLIRSSIYNNQARTAPNEEYYHVVVGVPGPEMGSSMETIIAKRIAGQTNLMPQPLNAPSNPALAGGHLMGIYQSWPNLSPVGLDHAHLGFDWLTDTNPYMISGSPVITPQQGPENGFVGIMSSAVTNDPNTVVTHVDHMYAPGFTLNISHFPNQGLGNANAPGPIVMSADAFNITNQIGQFRIMFHNFPTSINMNTGLPEWMYYVLCGFPTNAPFATDIAGNTAILATTANWSWSGWLDGSSPQTCTDEATNPRQPNEICLDTVNNPLGNAWASSEPVCVAAAINYGQVNTNPTSNPLVAEFSNHVQLVLGQ